MDVLGLVGCLLALLAFVSGGVACFFSYRAYSRTNRLQELLLQELRESRRESLDANMDGLSALSRTVQESGRDLERRVYHFTRQTEVQLASVRDLVESRLRELRAENAAELERMRDVVDKRLQSTLEARLGQSFGAVGERLEQVYQGLGEMRRLAGDVGDLKRVLSNVKSRGVFGEVRLGAILEDVLSPGQYEANVVTKPGTRAFVEYAIRLPGDGDRPVYLPVDAKFPMDAYQRLDQARESGDAAALREAQTSFVQRLRAFAKDIRDKYVDPPHTTEFAVLFLPFEAIYAECLRLNLLEALQRDFKVTLTGPATMAAFLNSLEMGFQTLAVQKRSSQVWELLGAVRTEFTRFAEALGSTRQRLEQAGDELDRLVGVRTRMIQKRLAEVSALEEDKAKAVLEDEEKIFLESR